MSLLKKRNIGTLILIVVVYVWFFLFQQRPQQNPVNVLGANTDVSLFEEPKDGREPILNAITDAKKEVLLEVYLLSDKQIIQALEDARSRGITVDVMLEEHPFGGGSLNQTTEKKLIASGISVEWSSPSFALTHEKAVVIDSSEVFVLSQNLTASSFSKNREYDVLDTDLKDVSEVRAIFIDDWERKSFTPTNSHLIVSPDNSRSGITGLIESSTKTIDIEIEDINDPQIVSLLSQDGKKMQVRLITPTLSQVSSNAEALKTLKKEGVLVRTLSSPYMHAKLILVDDTKAYVGSVNLSTQSMDKNRELGILLSQSDGITMLSQTFKQDWSSATDFHE